MSTFKLKFKGKHRPRPFDERVKSFIVDDGDHQLWGGYCSHNNQPHITLDNHQINVRRYIWQDYYPQIDLTGLRLRRNEEVCDKEMYPTCVNPSHWTLAKTILKQMTRTQKLKYSAGTQVSAEENKSRA